MIFEIASFAFLLGGAFARSTGAPMDACENMTPQHSGTTASDS